MDTTTWSIHRDGRPCGQLEKALFLSREPEGGGGGRGEGESMTGVIQYDEHQGTALWLALNTHVIYHGWVSHELTCPFALIQHFMDLAYVLPAVLRSYTNTRMISMCSRHDR